MRSQETPYQMKRLRRVLETQQHVGEHAQRPLPHNGVQQSTENLWVKEIIVKIHLYKPKRCLGHLMKYSLKLKVNGLFFCFSKRWLQPLCGPEVQNKSRSVASITNQFNFKQSNVYEDGELLNRRQSFE